ncbi:hypothetical protein [Streptomyces montanisoli]|uniref:Uncharacterized protein n=1 Tax=Streptomyces montanisoli TaxID=2798581 RepID=A0A940MHC3_9ACTN|nr:hypothetical protein [Streptomyces montanisoli]MBP0458613.1 hypothetical protein [Streptomyces montanisoli]
MTIDEKPRWLDALERSGLSVLQGPPPEEAPQVSDAIHAVAGWEVQPAAEISASDPRAAEELDEKWHERARACSLYDGQGVFLILPPVSGGSRTGWVKVSDPVGERLPSRIAAATGSPEFIAASLNGCHLCAVSVEDDEYWVVQHDFT